MLAEQFLWRFSLKNKRLKILANSETSKNEFVKNFSFVKEINILNNPFDTSKFIYRKKLNSYVRSIFYLGRLSSGKNLFQWINVVSELKNINGYRPCNAN